jgi:hypothetical protein
MRRDLTHQLLVPQRAQQAQEVDACNQANFVYNNKNVVHEVERPSGNSMAAVLRRLRKARPDIHARVLNGELSGYAGMVEAGFRKRDTLGGRTRREWSRPYDKIISFLSNHIVDLDAAEIKQLRDWIDGKLARLDETSVKGRAQCRTAETVAPMKTTDLDRLHVLASEALRDNGDLNEAAHKLAATLVEDGNRPLLVAVVLDFLARRPQE